MAERRFDVPLSDSGSVSAIEALPEASASDVLFIYAPGAGSSLLDPFGAYACARLAEANVASWRFQFPYMEAKRSAPDRPALLEATWRAVIDLAAAAGARLVAGGRSMGGRIASQVVAAGAPVSGLVLLAYPLHPPGQTEKRRDAHLPLIKVPTLFCSGTRDAFAAPEELTAAAKLVEGASVHFLSDADHGFNVAKSSGRGREDVWAEATDALLSFLTSLP